MRPRWLFLYLCVIVIGAGSCGLWYFSTPTNVKVRLKPGDTVSLTALRLNSQPLELYLLFDRVYGEKRPELGRFDTEFLAANGAIDFPDPGAPVKLQIGSDSTRTIYEALPARGADANHWRRTLVPFADDGNPNRIPWPSSAASVHKAEPGLNIISATVIGVGGPLENEVVTLSLAPPIDNSRAQPGYEFFLWFRFWLIYIILLVIYAGAASFGEPRKPRAKS